MRGAGLDDTTVVDPGSGRAGRASRRGGSSARRVSSGWGDGRSRRRGALPGVLCALAAFGALAALGVLAPPGSAATRSFALLPALGPLPILAAASGFGALAALSGIRRLAAGGSALLSVLEVALGSCPLLLAAGLWLLRFALSAP